MSPEGGSAATEDENTPPDQSEKRFSGNIRALNESDIEKLIPILKAWIRHPKTGEVLEDEIQELVESMGKSMAEDSGSSYVVAEDLNGEVIGMMGLKIPGELMKSFARTTNPSELINAYVSPSYRGGKGVGRALVSEIEKIAKEKGFQEIILNSGPRYVDSGWGFYDKLEGFERIGVAKDMYGAGNDAMVWGKLLSEEGV